MCDSRRYAEDANYWVTTVHPAKSQGEIIEMLEEFGSGNLLVTQGNVNARYAWLVRFEWLGATYRFVFTPLDCKHPDKVSSFSGKRRKHIEQSRYQMGRIASHFVKAILTAAEAHPHALFGFQELPGAGMHAGGIPITAGELDTTGLTALLPDIAGGRVAMLGDGGYSDEVIVDGELIST